MQAENKEKRAVVLGAYGFIGAACVSALKAEGFQVTGIGRSMRAGLLCDPGIKWIERDITSTGTYDLSQILKGVDVVVNASGALQDGVLDNLKAIHETAINQLMEVLSGTDTRFIQISAAGVSESANTEFMRSKMRGDQKIMESGLDYVILRPTIVIGSQAYGGTALLRACASTPLIGFRIFPDAPVQTVYVDDVARAVVQAARGDIASGTVADLTESEQYRFLDVVRVVRRWQGFPGWKVEAPVPRILIRSMSLIADGLGWLGWRSPLRTTAIRALEGGITGDPKAWREAGGKPCRPLKETLASIRSTIQERWFARIYLVLPMAIAILSLFWIASGVIGLIYRDEAIAALTEHGVSASFAFASVLTGSIIDIILGLSILVRKLVRWACIGMIAVSISYMVGAIIWAPDLWVDPLGPMVKVLPEVMLALMVAALMEKR